jgi:hypothetical protein
MTVSFVRWKDACSVEANSADPIAPVPQLSELCEIGFLLAENDEALLIGMEYQEDDTEPGRWRFNIPKVGIVERHDFDISKLVAKKKVKAPKKPSKKNAKKETTGQLLPCVSDSEQPTVIETCSVDAT